MESSSNKYSANAFANSVLPTPVVPKNMKEPIGFLGSCNPALLLLIASETAVMASSCPITRLCNSSSNCNNFSLSDCIILLTGIPVAFATFSAISSASTSSFINRFPLTPNSCNCFVQSANSVSASFNLPYLISATFP